MTNHSDTTELLEATAAVLLRCFIFGFIVLLLWFGMLMAVPGLVHSQGEWFGLSANQVDVINYCGMGLFKLLVVLFFFFPYIAVRFVLGKRTA